jgi:hypothetical protein
MSALRNTVSKLRNGAQANLLKDATTKLPTGAKALSDTLDLLVPCTGFMLMSAGNIKVLAKDDEEADAQPLTGLLVGVEYGFNLRRIYVTGTTVPDADIVLLYGKY